ncbi:MAG TPA: NAD(P)H-dependent oxidoreductase subunit E, partial [Bacteroidales bacterium]|nr:NAD(P)H-dependent oxidoreductase subunit E [Bacteroidales bacterium]
MGEYQMQILVCGGYNCKNKQSSDIIDSLKLELEAVALDKKVKVVKSNCFGLCTHGPVVKILPDGTVYTGVKTEDINDIINEHILKGRKVERLLFHDPVSGKTLTDEIELSPLKKQLRIVLRNCGIIDPENIEDAIARGAYMALGKVLTTMQPDEAIKIIKDSGLRGRGGGGFPTGVKWEIARKNTSDEKYVVCNADEGDPGAFMDRSVLEGDPHAVLEAMAICGYCIGASKGLVYIRAEYPLAVKRLKIAIDQAREYGLLGKDIMG